MKVIAKLKPGYRFLDHPVHNNVARRSEYSRYISWNAMQSDRV